VKTGTDTKTLLFVLYRHLETKTWSRGLHH